MILALCHAIAAIQRSKPLRLWVFAIGFAAQGVFSFWVGTVWGGAK